MKLVLTGTHDEALLALVIKHGEEVAKRHRTYVGRTAIQKVMYYLKTQGVPMSYKFDIYHYGPYCQDIVNDIDWLLADKVIVDNSNNPDKYSNYAPADAMDELLSLNEKELAGDEELIRKLVEAFMPLDPNMLEVIATLDYLHRAEIAKGTNGDLKQIVVNRFFDYKKDKYSRNLVEEMYDLVTKIIGAS